MKKVLLFVIGTSFLFLTTLTYFLYSSYKPKLELPINNSYELFEYNKDISLLAISPQNNSNVLDEFYLVNKNDGSKNLLLKSNLQVELISNEKSTFILDEPSQKTFIALAEFTELKSMSQNQKSYQRAHIFSIEEDGSFQEIYTSKLPVDSISVKNGSLMIYEKMYDDSLNVFPDTLKPYYKISKSYKDGSFTETSRTYVEPFSKKAATPN